MIEVLEKLIKKIPKRGLNNMTRQTYYKRYKFEEPFDISRMSEYEYVKVPCPYLPEPTIRRRMDKLYDGGMFGIPFLPAPMVIMASEDAKGKAKVLLTKCLDDLDVFSKKLDTITVVEKDDIENYKYRVQKLSEFLIKTGKIVGLIQDAEWRIIG